MNYRSDLKDINNIPEDWTYISLEEIVQKEGCDREERIEYDYRQHTDNDTDDPEELKRWLAEMKLVGRKIKDIRFISHVYNMIEDEICDRLWMVTEGYPKEIHDFISNPQNVDDLFPYPLTLEMDEPMLIKFEDGDQFEINTNVEGRFYVGMNSIPWNTEGRINLENVNGSILLDSLKGATITSVDVITRTEGSGEKIIDLVKLDWWKDYNYSIVVGSWAHDYMMVDIMEYPTNILKCPFGQVKKSLYKN